MEKNRSFGIWVVYIFHWACLASWSKSLPAGRCEKRRADVSHHAPGQCLCAFFLWSQHLCLMVERVRGLTAVPELNTATPSTANGSTNLGNTCQKMWLFFSFMSCGCFLFLFFQLQVFLGNLTERFRLPDLGELHHANKLRRGKKL